MQRARSVLGGTSPAGVDACAHIHARMCAGVRVTVRVCACAPSCARARGPQRRGARTAAAHSPHGRGALSTREHALCVRRVCLPTALRAGGRARSVRGRRRVLTAHTARVPAVPRECRVSTVGGAAVKTTYGLMATASLLCNDYNPSLLLRPLPLHYDFHPKAAMYAALNEL